MSADENLAALRRAADAINTGNLAVLDEVFSITEIHDARFTSEVHPGDCVRANVVLTEDDGQFLCDASFHTDRGPAAKMRLTLRAKTP